MRVYTQEDIKKRRNSSDFTALKNKVQLEKPNSKTIYIFDIDFTILNPLEPSLHLGTISLYRKDFYKFLSNMKLEQRQKLLNYVTYYDKVKLVHSGIPSLISLLSKKNIATIGLSSMAYGDVCHLKMVHEERNRNLTKYKIKFSPSFISLCNSFLIQKSFFYDGILYSNTVEREGKALAFFQLLSNYKNDFDQIIYVDDNEDNFLEMKKYIEVNQIKIGFDCFHFLEAYNVQCDQVSLEDFTSFWEKRLQEIKAPTIAK